MADALFDPRLLAREAFVPHDYAALLEANAILPELQTPEKYRQSLDKYALLTDVRVERIAYSVGGRKVTGVMALPVKPGKGKHPIFIYNRGGNGEFGKLTVGQVLRFMVPFAERGYLAFGSNYRGNDGGDGEDEMGGADVEDVLTLIAVAKNHPAWDGKNIFMLGVSRGGMTGAMVLKASTEITAAALSAGLFDLETSARERGIMEEIFRKRVPGYADDRQAAIFAGSAVCWPERLNTPLLLLHGTNDTRVNVSHSIDLARGLAREGKPHKLVIYEGDDHFLTHNGRAAMEEMLRWYEGHRQRP